MGSRFLLGGALEGSETRLIEKTLVVHDHFPLPARRLAGLVQQATRLNRRQSEQLIRQGNVLVNGRCVRRVDHPLQLGDRLEVGYEPDDLRPQQAHPSQPSSYQELTIAFEDQHLLVVNKPPDLLTVPTPQREKNTLLGLLRKRYDGPGGEERVFCVHRLDRGVSGLLVFGKDLEIARKLRQQFAERKPDRRYLTLVHGELSVVSGTIRSFLATDDHLNRYSCAEEHGGELAITHYRRLAMYEQHATLVEVHLETGRRNQIRVHLAEAGHPVIGDSRYGRDLPPHPFWPYKRLALHAESLGFEHPVTGRSLTFRQPLPPEMLDFQRRARKAIRRSRSSSPSNRQSSPPDRAPSKSRRRSGSGKGRR